MATYQVLIEPIESSYAHYDTADQWQVRVYGAGRIIGRGYTLTRWGARRKARRIVRDHERALARGPVHYQHLIKTDR